MFWSVASMDSQSSFLNGVVGRAAPRFSVAAKCWRDFRGMSGRLVRRIFETKYVCYWDTYWKTASHRAGDQAKIGPVFRGKKGRFCRGQFLPTFLIDFA